MQISETYYIKPNSDDMKCFWPTLLCMESYNNFIIIKSPKRTIKIIMYHLGDGVGGDRDFCVNFCFLEKNLCFAGHWIHIWMNKGKRKDFSRGEASVFWSALYWHVAYKLVFACRQDEVSSLIAARKFSLKLTVMLQTYTCYSFLLSSPNFFLGHPKMCILLHNSDIRNTPVSFFPTAESVG